MRVTTSPLVKLYALEEFWDLPEPADGSKLELIGGVLYVTPPPDHMIHDPVAAGLNELLVPEILRLGRPGRLFFPRSGIRLPRPASWLEPDLYYLSNASIERFGEEPRTSADLVIEILSPGSAAYDRTTKADTYAALGVAELWLVDPDTRSIEVRYAAGGEWVETRTFQAGEHVLSRVLPGLELAVADVLQDLPGHQER